MAVDLMRLKLCRDTQGSAVTPKVSHPTVSVTGAEEMAAAANALLIALADSKVCKVCEGASWLGQHSLECPVPELEKCVRKSKYLSTNQLEIEKNLVVRKDENNQVTVYGIPWPRWMRLNTYQRVDVMRKTKRFHHRPRAIKMTCRWCNNPAFVITPLRKGQRIDTCFDCYCIFSRPIEDVETAFAEAKAKAAWARKHVPLRVVHRIQARELMKQAVAVGKILKQLRSEAENAKAVRKGS